MAKVKIVAKIRPFIGSEVEDDALLSDGHVLSLKDSRNAGQRIQYGEFAACYDEKLKDGTKSSLFETEIEPLLTGVFEGKNLTVMCYGVTSSGKTTTLQGNRNQPGLIVQAVEAILHGQNRRESSSSNEYIYKLFFYEVYCDKLYDLLISPKEGPRTDLKIRQNEFGQDEIVNLTHQKFDTLETFESIYRRVVKARSTATTSSNHSSSRSHAIMRILVCKKPLNVNATETLTGQIEFVDLAGSESNKDAQTGGRPVIGPKSAQSRPQESASINQSLLALKTVVKGLNDNMAAIAYRGNILTRVLKNALSGKSSTLLICNIAPGFKWLKSTRATIEFATEAKSIKVVPNTIKQDETKKRIEHLKRTDVEFNRAVQEALQEELAKIRALENDRTCDTTHLSATGTDTALNVGPDSKPDNSPKLTLKHEESIKEEVTGMKSPFDADSANISATPRPEPMPHLEREHSFPEPLQQPTESLIRTPSPQNMDQPSGEGFNDIDIPPPVVDEPSPLPEEPLPEIEQPASAQLVKESLPKASKRSAEVKRSGQVDGVNEEQGEYRRKLARSLKEEQKKYPNSNNELDKRRVAKAAIMAGTMALKEKDDLEFAITMFEKAIRWYPENELILEETLKLKKRLREQRGIPEISARGASKGNSKRLAALQSNRLANSKAATGTSKVEEKKKKRRPLFEEDADGPFVMFNQTTTKPASSSRAKGKGKGRPVMEKAAAAFADSDIEQFVDSEDEIEKDLVIEDAESSPVKQAKGKEKGRARSKKRKSSTDEDHSEQEEERPQKKKSRRALF